MISLLKKEQIPFLSIELKKRSEETLGELFSYFILETIFMSENLKVNPFNQPAVEKLKILTLALNQLHNTYRGKNDS